MLNDQYIDRTITAKLQEDDLAKSLAHTPSGRLSASQLGAPAQWQVLKALGVGTRVIDPYVLRKFLRGNQVEEWFVQQMPGVIELQKPLNYRNVGGVADAVVDTANYDHKLGVIPHEVKSVTNAKFKRIEKTGSADPQHKLQAGLYALALGASHYAIDYIASDDFRLLTYIYPTGEIKGEIDAIITEYDGFIANHTVPAFVAKQKWQESKDYNQYPEWKDLSEKECQMLLKVAYPKAWEVYDEKH